MCGCFFYVDGWGLGWGGRWVVIRRELESILVA